MAAIIAVDDIHKTYDELVAKGVEFTEEPTERFYGTDCGLRDPFGNYMRIGTPKEGPMEFPLRPSSPRGDAPDPRPCRDARAPLPRGFLRGRRAVSPPRTKCKRPQARDRLGRCSCICGRGAARVSPIHRWRRR